MAQPCQIFPKFGSLPAARLLGFRTLRPQISSEFDGCPKKIPGQISNKFGGPPESKFLENFVPGVSVCLPRSCLGLSLFVSMCPCLSFVSISLRLFVSHFRVSVSVYFGNVCVYLFLFVCVCFCGSVHKDGTLPHCRVLYPPFKLHFLPFVLSFFISNCF